MQVRVWAPVERDVNEDIGIEKHQRYFLASLS